MEGANDPSRKARIFSLNYKYLLVYINCLSGEEHQAPWRFWLGRDPHSTSILVCYSIFNPSTGFVRSTFLICVEITPSRISIRMITEITTPEYPIGIE